MGSPAEPEQRTEQAEKQAEAPAGAPKPGERRSGLLTGIVVYLVIGVLIVSFSHTVQRFLLNNLIPAAIVTAIIVMAVLISTATSGKWAESVSRLSGLIIFFVLPVLLGLVAAIALVPESYQVPMLRSVFLVVVTMLPATLYYLFISSRKSSLLQEYVANLARLGLLRVRARAFGEEGDMERKLRVRSYIQRFEALYGEVSDSARDQIMRSTDLGSADSAARALYGRSTPGALGGVFTRATLIPVIVATVLIGLGWLLVLPPWVVVGGNAQSLVDKLQFVLHPHEIPVFYAFLGAYFFSIQMLFRRYVRKDLHANAYIAVSLRIILAVVGTWTVLLAAAVLPWESKSEALPVIAFVIGAFPPIAWQVIQAAFRKVTGAAHLVPSLSSAMPVSELDGLTVWHEARLEEEDIENIPNMATADVVELMLHTRFPPGRIIDWVDQAILYTQLSKDRDADAASSRQQLGAHGIRTASALIAAYGRSIGRRDVEAFENILPGEGRKRLRSLADTLTTNPNLELIMQWRGLEPADHLRLVPVVGTAKPGADKAPEPPVPPTQPPVRDQAVPPLS